MEFRRIRVRCSTPDETIEHTTAIKWHPAYLPTQEFGATRKNTPGSKTDNYIFTDHSKYASWIQYITSIPKPPSLPLPQKEEKVKEKGVVEELLDKANKMNMVDIFQEASVQQKWRESTRGLFIAAKEAHDRRARAKRYADSDGLLELINEYMKTHHLQVRESLEAYGYYPFTGDDDDLIASLHKNDVAKEYLRETFGLSFRPDPVGLWVPPKLH